MNDLSIIIMAAGKGTRMNSKRPKVLHELAGKSLINHVINTAKLLSPKYIVVILGYESDLIKQSINDDNILFSIQRRQKGTGHAVMKAKQHLHKFKGQTLVLSGDVPLIKKETLISLYKKQINNNLDACMLTADMEDPTGYGRVIRDGHEHLKYVKEHKDCNEQQIKVKEINSGIYIFNTQTLFKLLPKLDNNNSQSEYYLPDVLSLIIAQHGKIGLEKTMDNIEIQGVNTLEQLLYLEKEYQKYE